MLRARQPVSTSEVDADGRPASVAPLREPADRPVLADGLNTVARIVWLIAGIVAFVICAGILLVVLKANPSNSIVSEVHSWASWLAAPFRGIFSLHSTDATIAVNWGIAAFIYLLAGALVVRLLGRNYR
jgi:hypothetical protein